MPANGNDLKARYSKLLAKRSEEVEFVWWTLERFVHPRGQQQVGRGTQQVEPICDSTGIESNTKLAAGCMQHITPAASPWFKCEAPEGLEANEEAKRWYADVGQRMQAALARSNFYSSIHECYLDRGAFGTASLFCEERRGGLYFECWPIREIVVGKANDGDGFGIVFRLLRLSAKQAAAQFGDANIPPEVKGLAGKAETADQEADYLHCIYERDSTEVDDTKTADKWPVASVYLHHSSGAVVNESGYAEWPAFVSRFLQWGSRIYGYAPGMLVQGVLDSLNKHEDALDTLARTLAFPRVLIPDSLKSVVDMRPGGVTMFQDGSATLPKEWATGGSYQAGEHRSEVKRRQIENAFHVPLFDMFSGVQRQITAEEVRAREDEKLVQFSPTFALLTSDFLIPILNRVFAIMLRQGAFGPVPPGVASGGADGMASIANPKVTFTSRMALRMDSLRTAAWDRVSGRIIAQAEVNPEALDLLKWDEANRDIALSEGCPTNWLNRETDIREIRAARAEAQRQQQEQAAMLAASVKATPTLPA